MSEIVLARPSRLCHDAVVIDGIGGCGKTMLSAVVASLERVELLKYSYEIEQYCIMRSLGLMSMNSASQLIRFQMDLMLYNVMMGRDVNFRFSDLSSVFNSRRRLTYVKRVFARGDEVVPERVREERPILHIATHDISAFASPILSDAASGLLFITMHRHPLFMLKQNTWNMDHLLDSPRHFGLYYKWKTGAVPFYFAGREDQMLAASAKEKAIFYIETLRRRAAEGSLHSNEAHFYELTFESFVQDPDRHIDVICDRLRTSRSSVTSRVLKREKIPRTLLTAGRARPIYRRVGWKEPDSRTREGELDAVMKWAYDGVSESAREALDWLRADYEALSQRLDGAA